MSPHKMVMRLSGFQTLVSLQLCAIISVNADNWLSTKLFVDHEYLLGPIKINENGRQGRKKKAYWWVFSELREKWEIAS